ncbi:hypothetical protein ACFFLM_25940, partial [Deinococcus oregonensis]
MRAGEPLLAALATLGAAISTWMLTDDLGPWSTLAMGLTALMPAVAIPHLMRLVPGRVEQDRAGIIRPEVSTETGLAREASLILTVLAAAALPVGHVLAALSHAPEPSSPARTVLGLVGVHGGAWGWTIGTLLALAPALLLLRGAPLLATRSAAGTQPAGGTPSAPAPITASPESLPAAPASPPYRTLGTAAALCAVTPFLTAAPLLGTALQRAAPG